MRHSCGAEAERVFWHGDSVKANPRNVKEQSVREVWYCPECNVCFNPQLHVVSTDANRTIEPRKAE